MESETSHVSDIYTLWGTRIYFMGSERLYGVGNALWGRKRITFQLKFPLLRYTLLTN